MTTYTLEQINEIVFNGFNYTLPVETVDLISKLSLEVGSPTYIKTPVFQKREKPAVALSSANIHGHHSGGHSGGNKKKRGHKNNEISDNDWEMIRNFQSTKIDKKEGVDAQINVIRTHINKMSDANCNEMKQKIVDLVDEIYTTENVDDMNKVSSILFDIASTNLYYSKIYADLYAELMNRFPSMKTVFDKSIHNYMALFDNIEYVDPAKDYDAFCKINKTNEKRKSLSAFFVNLMKQRIVENNTIIELLRNLLAQFYKYISQENKRNEVDELTENIAILYDKQLFEGKDEDDFDYEEIDGYTIPEMIEKIATSKVKDYASLTNKSVFKFMDLLEK